MHAKEASRPSQDGSQEASCAPQAPQEEVIADRSDAGALGPRLEREWGAILAGGGVDYDPREAEIIDGRVLGDSSGPRAFRFLFLPGRLSRPGAAGGSVSLDGGLLKPHTPCPFDDASSLVDREILRLVRADRRYHFAANKYPVKPFHYLLIRTGDAPASVLPQCIFGAAELEDTLLLARSIGPSFRVFFNSNAGRDGSHSGSSVNHWHFQILPDSGDVLEAVTDDSESIPNWPVPHRLAVGTDVSAVAAELWDATRVAVDRDRAFTLAIQARDDGLLVAAVFARAPLESDKIDVLSHRFGGFELTGSAVLYSAESLRWVREHPGDANALAWRRLQLGLGDIWS